MSKVFSLKLAKQSAEALLKEDGLLALPVDPFAIAASREIVVEGKPEAVDGVSGMLLRHGNDFGIVYATHIKSKGFQRFSVAHELGHYFLPGHVDQVIKGGIHVSRAGFVTNDPFELEADHFAAGLLMPEQPFRKEVDRYEPGLIAIEAIASHCVTSLTAAAIRYAEVGRMASAIVMSTGGIVDYCFVSDMMKSLPRLQYLRKGSRLPIGSVSSALAADPTLVAAGQRFRDDVDVRDWFGGETKATVVEEAVGLGSYGKVLTVLTSSKIGQDLEPDDDDEEQELIESWTPRFNK
ncbi:ImmA/IrrE family metallo-endopeptidase [Sinorhizobium sp. BJ1]|uniref:ImmA/IrrE family metallo-endopeptidase n=1 Tax=Sinorhizobium sp. BJ1 TaxID=2035455 RepID=UPI000BEA6174|nr:ImmA/IrrE family metallo-endopeptidase [Sinorhizobium sp. BJ1]PDT80862.1 hypothetical protein CO676_25400 [Sinorhizobium sp. BJ1]